MGDSEYEYYTDEDDDERELTKLKDPSPDDLPVTEPKAWRKKFDAELEFDSGRESLTEISSSDEVEHVQVIRKSTDLHYAVIKNDFMKVNSLIDAGYDPNAQDENGMTSLHLACRENNQSLVLLLLARGADGSVIDESRRSPLHYAVQGGVTKIVQSLLDYDIYMDGKDRLGQTVLHNAAINELSATMNLLLSRKKMYGTEEDLLRFTNIQNRDKQTALHIAAEHGCCDCVKILLKYKCDLDLTDMDGRTALHLACGTNIPEVTEMQSVNVITNLINKGCSLSVRDENGYTPFLCSAVAGRAETGRVLLQESTDKYAKDSQGWTAMHLAARLNQTNFIKMLKKAEFSVDIKDDNGCTPMHHAILTNSLAAVKILVEVGADINIEDTENRKYTEFACLLERDSILLWLAKKFPELYLNEHTQESIVHYLAAHEGTTHISKELFSTGYYSVETRDATGKTPLHYAAINNKEESFQFLVDTAGGDIDVRDHVGATPLHFAVRWGSESIVRFILRKKGTKAPSVLNLGDRLGRTPIHYAATQKTGLTLISNLLKAGAAIDHVDNSGMTALHQAARFGNISLVRVLMDEGANLSVKDRQGMTPLDHAREKECSVILGMLQKTGSRECSNRTNC